MSRANVINLDLSGSISVNPFLIIGWEPEGSEEGPLGSSPRVGADRVGYRESGNTPGYSWDGL